VLSPVSIDALSKMSLIAVDSVSDVASSLVSVDPVSDMSPLVSVDSVSDVASSLVSVDPVSDVASSSPPVSVDPLAYIIAVAGKNNEDIIKSNSKLVIWFIIPFLIVIYIKISLQVNPNILNLSRVIKDNRSSSRPSYTR
jgi:hypothetical protein